MQYFYYSSSKTDHLSSYEWNDTNRKDNNTAKRTNDDNKISIKEESDYNKNYDRKNDKANNSNNSGKKAKSNNSDIIEEIIDDSQNISNLM